MFFDTRIGNGFLGVVDGLKTLAGLGVSTGGCVEPIGCGAGILHGGGC